MQDVLELAQALRTGNEHEPSTTGLSRVVLDPCLRRDWAARFASYYVNHRERIQFDHV